MSWRISLLTAGSLALLALAAIPAADYYYRTAQGEGCARCHEIRPNLESWQQSAHRKINCVDCHASTTLSNARRVARHLSGTIGERVQMKLPDVLAMVERCQSCHQQEFAQWRSGPHSTTYARIFTDAEHNRKRRLMDDCLRCHGMHFPGGISDLVEPVSTAGPWKLKDPKLATAPAIPCLSCHSMHRAGDRMQRTEKAGRTKEEILRPSIGLRDRRTQLTMTAGLLPLPEMQEGTRRVRTSPDRRQSLCYQCHAPLDTRQVASGDDRTPTGVHEGISCLSCHLQHGSRTRASCASCHPRLSNCGLDVEKMDTTFAMPSSRHNIHFVKCADCHPKGVPRPHKRSL